MALWLWIAAIVFVVWLVGGRKQKPARNSRTYSHYSSPPKQYIEPSDNEIDVAAKQIADTIKSQNQLDSLERKMNNAHDKMCDARTEAAELKAEILYETYERAYQIAELKIFYWQYIPDLTLHTPSELISYAYQVYTPEEYPEIRVEVEQIQNGKYDFWDELYSLEEKEPKPSFLNGLRKFRQIIEGNEPHTEKTKKINQLASRSKPFREEFFSPDSGMKAADQYFADLLAIDGLPLAYELYLEGHTTPESCLDIDPAEFIKRKGIGPKKQAQLIKFQEKVREVMNPESISIELKNEQTGNLGNHYSN